ncbi:MAG: DUF2628 domain-containing protein [Pseudomonadota bacterium]|nr:DUF2628 domain-containing protein [Pseudomonadota bacterium]
MNIDQMERLAKLQRDGALTDEEFTAGKARLLSGSVTGEGAVPAAPQVAALNPKWERRFSFFDKYGSPLSKEASLASRDLKFGERAAIFFNVWALLLGVFYFIFVGIPKRGLTLFAIAIVLAMALWGIETFIDYSPNWYWLILWAVYGATANYYYYIKVRHGRDEWSPAKDLFS